jgi:DNA repair ATPase RecN
MDPFAVVRAPVGAVRAVIRAAEDLHDLAERARREPDPVEEIRERLDALLAVTSALHATAETIVTGGDDLRRTGEKLDVHVLELISGGRELTEVTKDVEDSMETVADTVEPLQGVARGVGRVQQRLSRG